MSFTTAARNAMLGGFTGTHLSAHTAYSTTGTNEVTGGTPAYARKSVTYGAAASEIRTASNTPTFDIPAATTVRWIGMWDAVTAGNFLGMIANGGTEQEFSVDLTANTVKIPAHGLVADQKIAFYGDTVPGGLTEGTVYFVRPTITTDTFQVGATAGGAAIDLTTEPGRKCVMAVIVEETFGAQGTLAVSPHSIRLDA
jgi:hypothetical protein